jgi:hypothetical protein
MPTKLLKEKPYKKHLKEIGCTKEEIKIVWENVLRRRKNS